METVLLEDIPGYKLCASQEDSPWTALYRSVWDPNASDRLVLASADGRIRTCTLPSVGLPASSTPPDAAAAAAAAASSERAQQPPAGVSVSTYCVLFRHFGFEDGRAVDLAPSVRSLPINNLTVLRAVADPSLGGEVAFQMGVSNRVVLSAFPGSHAPLAADSRAEEGEFCFGTGLFEVACHATRVTVVSASPDGAMLVTGDEDGMIQVCQLQPLSQQAVKAHRGPVNCCAWWSVGNAIQRTEGLDEAVASRSRGAGAKDAAGPPSAVVGVRVGRHGNAGGASVGSGTGAWSATGTAAFNARYGVYADGSTAAAEEEQRPPGAPGGDVYMFATASVDHHIILWQVLQHADTGAVTGVEPVRKILTDGTPIMQMCCMAIPPRPTRLLDEARSRRLLMAATDAGSLYVWAIEGEQGEDLELVHLVTHTHLPVVHLHATLTHPLYLDAVRAGISAQLHMPAMQEDNTVGTAVMVCADMGGSARVYRILLGDDARMATQPAQPQPQQPGQEQQPSVEVAFAGEFSLGAQITGCSFSPQLAAETTLLLASSANESPPCLQMSSMRGQLRRWSIEQLPRVNVEDVGVQDVGAPRPPVPPFSPEHVAAPPAALFPDDEDSGPGTGTGTGANVAGGFDGNAPGDDGSLGAATGSLGDASYGTGAGPGDSNHGDDGGGFYDDAADNEAAGAAESKGPQHAESEATGDGATEDEDEEIQPRQPLRVQRHRMDPDQNRDPTRARALVQQRQQRAVVERYPPSSYGTAHWNSVRRFDVMLNAVEGAQFDPDNVAETSSDRHVAATRAVSVPTAQNLYDGLERVDRYSTASESVSDVRLIQLPKQLHPKWVQSRRENAPTEADMQVGSPTPLRRMSNNQPYHAGR